MERVHKQLLDRRDQILASVQVHQGFVSCIRRLPPEILSGIFVQCLPPETLTEPDARAAPLLLMRVCRGWREVAHGTPRLWCSLSVRPSRFLGPQQPKDLVFYHHWLSRARGCPLSLAVDTGEPSHYPGWQHEVTEFLQPYTSRVVRLHVTFRSNTVPDLLLGDLPLLEHLTLNGHIHGHANIARVQPAPRLRRLTLDGFVFSAGVLSAFNSYWTHLTQLRVTLSTRYLLNREINGLFVLTLLELCPHLQDFVLSSVSIPQYIMEAGNVRVVTHSHLRSFDVEVLYGIPCLLGVLTLPALKHLKITGIGRGTWRQNEFSAFVTRSRCPLETLKLYGGQLFSEEDQAEYLALIPTLKHVDLSLDTLGVAV